MVAKNVTPLVLLNISIKSPTREKLDYQFFCMRGSNDTVQFVVHATKYVTKNNTLNVLPPSMGAREAVGDILALDF